jgi:putative heme transporter
VRPVTTPAFRPGRVVAGLLIALVVAAVVIISIGRLAGFSRLADTLREGDTAWLGVCAVGQVVVFAGYTGAFREAVAFEDGPAINTSLALRVVLASFGLSQLFAAGGAAGLAVTYWALRRLRFEPRDAAVRLIGLATSVYLVFGIIGFVAAVLALMTSAAPLGMTVPWIAGMPIILVAAAWFTDERRVIRWTAPEGGIVRRGLATGVGAAWWVRRARASPDGRRVFAWSIAYWAGDIASLWAALHAFGGDPGLIALTLVYATGYLAQSIPIPFVATGGMDAATTFALTAVGVPLEVALVAVVAHRVFAFWIPLIPGLVCAAWLRSTGHALALAAGPSADSSRETAPGAGRSTH